MLCENCSKVILLSNVEKILAAREVAIKRINERNNNASKNEKIKEK